MPDKKIEEIIKKLNSQIKAKIQGFEGSYLYGSTAKGTSNINSDIDVVNIFDRNLSRDEELDLAGIVSDIDYQYNVFIDYHNYTLDQLKKNPVFYKEVIDKGFYYEAA